MNEKIYQRLINDLADSLKNKALGDTTAVGSYESGGLFADVGASREVFNAYVTPAGIQSALPTIGSDMSKPIVYTIAGVGNDATTLPDKKCDDAPAGFFRGCAQTWKFGRIRTDTNNIELEQLTLVDNMGVTTDLQVIGQVLGRDDLRPSMIRDDPSLMLNVVTYKEMLTAALLLQRGIDPLSANGFLGLARMIWQGDPTVFTTGKGYEEFKGLDLLINTGIVDAFTTDPCPELDSLVSDFAFASIDGVDSSEIVRTLSQMENYLVSLANSTGLAPVEWKICMHPDMWYALTEIWPIAYNTNRGATILSGNTELNIDGNILIAERDRMRRVKTLEINANSYEVICDDSIFRNDNSLDVINLPNVGDYASSIYFVPMRVGNNVPSTYLEYNDHRRYPAELRYSQGRTDFWTDSGMFEWAIQNQGFCHKYQLSMQPRLVLRTPHLAARLDNIKYTLGIAPRTSVPGQSTTVEGGGVATRPGITVTV